ncbi:TonB-dependent receptor [Chitinimonas sp. BJYL2]|uniref:TonB-dependent receptor n=1 Tax=Chitinimonas sp. BJYL2 TaxID=2976696 RepID=UPI0022B46F27|nr:TonB-dependent receptor [Chitinimonas sp. BJYL2]
MKPAVPLRPRVPLTRIAAACAALLTPAALHAQEAEAAPKEASQQSEVVVVTGVRASLNSSLNMKRNAQGVVDGIVAEDIGKFPDTNLAEAMQRISGVAIDRSIGEGSKVTVRGVGPDFNLVLLNGRQMPASSLGETGPSNSRAFDFANLASESIAAMEVYKTSRAENPAGGIGAVINIKTARPLETKREIASFGLKVVNDRSNDRLPELLQGDDYTPEVSGIYSNVFADGTFGIALSGSYQKRDLGYNQASVPNGWRAFKGDENNWGTIPQPGQPGSERITNRPKAGDIYSVPQNLNYSVNGIQRERTNGQLTLQYAPMKDLTATVDYTYSENKIQTRRNDLSAWFNFGPTTTTWTNGPVAAPLLYTEIIAPATSDVAMGSANFGTRNKNESAGFNLSWKANAKLKLDFDMHRSSAISGADSPFGSNAVLGGAMFNRGTTTVDFSQPFPVLSIASATLDPSKMLVTGSSFRNSYMKAEVEQAQFKGKYALENDSKLDFGISTTKVKNRSAYANVQQDSWGGRTSPADYPDNLYVAQPLAPYFSQLMGSNGANLFNGFFVYDFGAVRDAAVKADGSDKLFKASSDFTTDRRTQEDSKSVYVQYSTDWEWVVPLSAAFGLRHEQTKVKSSALVPTATGITWMANNEFSVQFGQPGFTTLEGKYNYTLPSMDLEAELTDRTKARFSYGESIGRPGWGDIQGGQTLNQLARITGGTGAQGDPGLKPLLAKNFDLSLEHYYARGSYVALGLFRKNISNYIGTSTLQATPFNLRTPANGTLFKEAVTKGCVTTDLTCIRNYILNTYNGTQGVVKTGVDSNGNATGTIAGQANDPIATFDITVPANQKKADLNGAEFNVQHQFSNTGFGISANYTYVKSGLKYDNASLKEQFALEGLGDAANLVGFYEDDRLSVRAAYNWRDKFLTARFDGSGLPNPVYTEAYGQWDVNVGYKWNKNLGFQLEVINLTDETQRLHGRAKEQVLYYTQTGRRFMMGARYTF